MEEGKKGGGLGREGKGPLLYTPLLFISADASVRKFQIGLAIMSNNLDPRVLSYPLSLRRAGRREPWERGCMSNLLACTLTCISDRQT